MDIQVSLSQANTEREVELLTVISYFVDIIGAVGCQGYTKQAIDSLIENEIEYVIS